VERGADSGRRETLPRLLRGLAGYSIWRTLQTGIEQPVFWKGTGGSRRRPAGRSDGSRLLYFTPFHRACLSHCRNPLTYFLARWNNGPRRGFVFGLTHELTAWAVVGRDDNRLRVGVMNILWMVFLTLLVCLEKLALTAIASARLPQPPLRYGASCFSSEERLGN